MNDLEMRSIGESRAEILFIKILSAMSLLSSCATGTPTLSAPAGSISGPKEIAIVAPRAPWISEIETRLREQGVKLKRWASIRQIEQAYGNGKEIYKEASTPYILEIDGYADLYLMHRCVGGGYNFDYITAELIDVTSNEVVFSMHGRGHSEGCAPLSGTIFRDIAFGVSSLW